MVDEKKTSKDEKLIAEAAKAYGIAEKHILASRVAEDGRAVIVTKGGTKVFFASGDKVDKLDPIAVHGIPPAKPKKRVH